MESAPAERGLRESYTRGDLLATAVCLALIIGLYLYFSFWI